MTKWTFNGMGLSGARRARTGNGGSGAARRQGLDEPFQSGFQARRSPARRSPIVPVAMNFDLTEGWWAGLKKELEPYGVKFEIRDPNWNTNAGAQAVTSLISEKPAVMVDP